jgi:23S rRNA pseudouridine955/2504/2580 synthase
MVIKSPQRLSFTISADHVGRRIDNFLFGQLKHVPKSLVYRLLRQRAIRVNGKRIAVDYRLQLNDEIKLPVMYYDVPDATEKGIDRNHRWFRELEQAIIVEDDQLLIINKPAGLAVHGGSGVRYGLIEVMKQMRPDLDFLALAHRLDRDTSGCLLLAKTPKILRMLHAQLREGNIYKCYHALVQGQWPAVMNEVALPLQRDCLQSGERMVKVDEEGKASMTTFQPLQTWSEATLVQAVLLTGRTHQIRVHTSYVGHPIAGDQKYGDRQFNAIMRKRGLKRLFLHAQSIRFQLPTMAQPIVAVAPLPTALTDCLSQLSAM